MDYSNLFVVLMGICTVFIGLVCIIVIVSIMGSVCRKMAKPEEKKMIDEAANAKPFEDLAMVAAISAAIAEDMGRNVSSVRIKSIKRM